MSVKLLKPHPFDNKTVTSLFLAGDRLQSIYNISDVNWKNLGIEIHGGGRSKLLKHSYRTGKSHINLALDYLVTHDQLRRDVEKFYEGRDGIENVSDEDGTLSFIQGGNEAIVEHISTLVNKAGINPSDILVLSPVWATCEGIKAKLPRKLREESLLGKDVSEDKMMFTTYHSSKGLERKVVILADINSVRDPRLVYVGMTRASEILYIHSWDERSPSTRFSLEQLWNSMNYS